jgi:glycosyltransferase involved in cell wall biosynthesis
MVHDLSFKRFPEFYSLRERFIFNCLLPYSIAKADAVIVPSNFTKNELIKYYPTHKNIEKVFVIENGIDKAFTKINKKRAGGEIFKKYKIKTPYILTINSRNPKKNIDGVIKGFNLFSIKNPKYNLIIVNGRHNIKEKDLKRIMILNHVSDEDLKNLYNGCELFIYYSKYEGFGMPIVEALQCVAPVIASDIPPHREITDDKIIYVKPSDFIDLSSKMDFLIKNRQYQEQMVKKTKKTISRFTWENNAKKTIDLYKLILNH